VTGGPQVLYNNGYQIYVLTPLSGFRLPIEPKVDSTLKVDRFISIMQGLVFLGTAQALRPLSLLPHGQKTQLHICGKPQHLCP
jgi:hypothetical protein